MPITLTSIEQAASFLLAYSPEKQAGQTYTLERMKLLMERLGNPQDKLIVIHVAGTSGKTSTSYYVRALLEAHGQKTGLTSSPHITSITERVQVGGVPLRPSIFLRYLCEFLTLVKQWPELEPTYFELLTAFAFWVFEKEKVDYAVIEVGLGGLLDATNIINGPKVCVITPIGIDHTEVLGDTVTLIAEQKAGIITPESVVFSAPQEKVVRQIIQRKCEDENATLRPVEPLGNTSSNVPVFQQENFSLARAVVAFIKQRDSLPSIHQEKIDACISQTPPGRFEVYTIGDKTIILDGAHNPQKLEAFVYSLRRQFPEPITWLIGFVSASDSKIAACVEQIVAPADDYTVTEFSVGQDIKGRRSVPATLVADLLRSHSASCVVETDAFTALSKVLTTKKRTVVVSGSLYLVAQLRQAIIDQTT